MQVPGSTLGGGRTGGQTRGRQGGEAGERADGKHASRVLAGRGPLRARLAAPGRSPPASVAARLLLAACPLLLPP